LWKIGNGRKVKIWKDRWMPDLKVIDFMGDNCPLSEDACVEDLIDVDTKQWKRDLIFSCFDRIVAKQIINTPLSFRLPQDLMIWNWEKDGEYSVRSAYHLLCDEKARFQPGPSCPQSSKLWKEIWRAPVPNKIKNFMWRLAKNILPTRANLHKKGIHLDLICPLCSREEESSQHLFLKCDIFKLTLFASQLGSHIPIDIDLHDWILKWLVCQDPLGVQLFCTLMWKFWDGRNAVVFKGWQMDPTRLALEALNFVHEFNEANPSRNRRVMGSQTISQPSRCTSLFSLFVDAGCCNSGHTVWGLVLRNLNGETVLSACKREDITAEPLLAEALGVRWALQVAIEQGISSVSIYSDAANVVNCINKRSNFATINLIAQDCRNLMDGMENVSVMFISRSQNLDAHNLASLAKVVCSKTWLGPAPLVFDVSVSTAMHAAVCNILSCVPAL
jgi:ribonuclease HI